MAIPDLQQYPVRLMNYKSMFLFCSKMFISICGFSAKVTCISYLSEEREILTDINIFQE